MNRYKKARIKEKLSRKQPRCSGCGRWFTWELQPTLDHITPRARGGSDAYTNLQLLCFDCNQKKGSKSYAQWMKERKRHR